MSFILLDPAMPDHPKFVGCSPDVLALWTAAICYAANAVTDGFVPEAKVRTLINAPKRRIDEAVAWLTSVRPGCTNPSWKRVEGGWKIHDYCDPTFNQPTKNRIATSRAAGAEGGRRSAEARRQKYGTAQPAQASNSGSRTITEGGGSEPPSKHSEGGGSRAFEAVPKGGVGTPFEAHSSSSTTGTDVPSVLLPPLHSAPLQVGGNPTSVASTDDPAVANVSSFSPKTTGSESSRQPSEKTQLRRRIFEEWLRITGRTSRTRLDPKRQGRIDAAIATYPPDDILDALEGWKYSPHHAGRNDQGQIYNDIELLLRDAAHIEKFRDLTQAHREGRLLPAHSNGHRRTGLEVAAEDEAKLEAEEELREFQYIPADYEEVPVDDRE